MRPIKPSVDQQFMRLAHSLAMRAAGQTSPNPLVGAVVVKNGRVVGKDYHRQKGEPHAEVLAIEKAGTKASGGTLYVTLEPCCHLEKRTPPCVPRIIQSGIHRVVVSMEDPNPRVSGRGIRALRRRGIQVEVGLFSEKARSYNEGYIKFVRTGLPFVTLKVAASLDGKISSGSGESRWITGEAARRWVHRLRRKCDAVMVGIGTVLSDDPLLTARGAREIIREPLRIILDPNLRIPLKASVIREVDPTKTIVVAGPGGPMSKQRALEQCGVQVLREKCHRDGIDLASLVSKLGKMDITTVLIEGGSKINASALKSRIVDKVFFFLAPMIIGGNQAKGAFGGDSPRELKQAISLKPMTGKNVGRDFLLEAYLS